MTNLSLMSDSDLVARVPGLLTRERAAIAEVIAYLAEIERPRLYLDQACSCLRSYCIERCGYSEDEATKRVRVAQLARRLPRVIHELRGGAIHLTGLFLLAPYLTAQNADALLREARGLSRQIIEHLIARWFPKPDAPSRIEPLTAQPALPLAHASAILAGPRDRQVLGQAVRPRSSSRFPQPATACSSRPAPSSTRRSRTRRSS